LGTNAAGIGGIEGGFWLQQFGVGLGVLQGLLFLCTLCKAAAELT
jgi:hypothetical protein